MPGPAPVIVAIVISAAVGGAVIYFFVSNKAGARREEYMHEVNAVLDLLRQKAEKLVERIRKLEKETTEARREKERLETELSATKRELEKLKAEAANWQQAESAHGLTTRVALVRSSAVLSAVRYRPKKALQHLKERERELKQELTELD